MNPVSTWNCNFNKEPLPVATPFGSNVASKRLKTNFLSQDSFQDWLDNAQGFKLVLRTAWYHGLIGCQPTWWTSQQRYLLSSLWGTKLLFEVKMGVPTSGHGWRYPCVDGPNHSTFTSLRSKSRTSAWEPSRLLSSANSAAVSPKELLWTAGETMICQGSQRGRWPANREWRTMVYECLWCL